MRCVRATRYVLPLREGGSLPALIEADDDGMYVLKFHGAGQGPKVLIAELICAEIGRVLELPIPEVVLVDLDPALGNNEPDGEIQSLVQGSAGLNLAIDFLPGALAFDPLDRLSVSSELASAIVWFDAYLTNVDRTPRNTNMLLWHRHLWLIDHGAALYVHHSWDNYLQRALSPFSNIREHVLLPVANDIRQADRLLAPRITPSLIEDIVARIPDEWLLQHTPFEDVQAERQAYSDYLRARIESPRAFVEEAINVRTQGL